MRGHASEKAQKQVYSSDRWAHKSQDYMTTEYRINNVKARGGLKGFKRGVTTC